MSNQTIVAPDTTTVGESVSVGLEVCPDPPSEDYAPAGRVYLDVDGNRIINVTGLNLSDFCITQDAGQYSVGERFDDPPFADVSAGSGGDVTFTEPGEYTLESPTDTATITVEEQPFAPNSVSVSCAGSLPNQLTVGDSFTVSAEVVNNNDVSAGAIVEFQVGGMTDQKTVNVNANSTEQVSMEFTVESAGQVDVSVVKDDTAKYGFASTL